MVNKTEKFASEMKVLTGIIRREEAVLLQNEISLSMFEAIK